MPLRRRPLRHLHRLARPSTVHSAADKLGLKPLNLIIWAKTNAGMGSLYRSQHELLPLFKKGSSSHVNNVELGKRCRWRSNVWTYPGLVAGSDARRGLQDHPTVKPAAMLEDALLDLTTAATSSSTRSSAPARRSSRARRPVAYAVVSNSIRSTSTLSSVATRRPRETRRKFPRRAEVGRRQGRSGGAVLPMLSPQGGRFR